MQKQEMRYGEMELVHLFLVGPTQKHLFTHQNIMVGILCLLKNLQDPSSHTLGSYIFLIQMNLFYCYANYLDNSSCQLKKLGQDFKKCSNKPSTSKCIHIRLHFSDTTLVRTKQISLWFRGSHTASCHQSILCYMA